jgi:hypothetical protein
MATKSKAAYELKHTFFIYFLFSSSTSAGLLSSLNKHKNDCHSMFFMDWLFFISILMVFAAFMGIHRYIRRKYRSWASGQGNITISIPMSLKNASLNQTYRLRKAIVMLL